MLDEYIGNKLIGMWFVVADYEPFAARIGRVLSRKSAQHVYEKKKEQDKVESVERIHTIASICAIAISST